MFKILYAAQNNYNAAIQLARFLRVMASNDLVQIKIAAYKISTPKNQPIDWCLDSLLNVHRPETVLSPESDSFGIYFDQVKYYGPDLVISDLEYFTSRAANILNIPLWQCSSSLLNFAIEHKYNVGLFTRFSYLMAKNNAVKTGRQVNILDNSECNFVYSHLGDTKDPPSIKSGYDWIRPYHTVGKYSVPCQHNIVACTSHNDRKILAMLKRQGDCVVFTEYPYEQHQGLWLKDANNQEEYFCNLKNCNFFVCKGQTSFLADAFYNGKYSAVMTNFQDLECVMNSVFSEHLGLSSMIYQESDLEGCLDKTVESGYNTGVRYLHEYIDEII
jgi:uncharacterized protein (TIGR00661 family)